MRDVHALGPFRASCRQIRTASPCCVKRVRAVLRCPCREQVDYQEPAYAHGRIPQAPNKRERATTDREVLVARAIDRAIRPLFPPGYYNETQVGGSACTVSVCMGGAKVAKPPRSGAETLAAHRARWKTERVASGAGPSRSAGSLLYQAPASQSGDVYCGNDAWGPNCNCSVRLKIHVDQDRGVRTFS